MPKPTFQAGLMGNIVPPTTVKPSQTIAAFTDLQNIFEGHLVCEIFTSGIAPSNYTLFSVYTSYNNNMPGNTCPLNINQPILSGSTNIYITNMGSGIPGLYPGKKIALISGQQGEIVVINGILTGSNPYEIPVTPTINAYSGGNVYLMEQTPTCILQLGVGANEDFSRTMTLGTGQYIVGINNTDTSANVTVLVTQDAVTGYA